MTKRLVFEKDNEALFPVGVDICMNPLTAARITLYDMHLMTAAVQNRIDREYLTKMSLHLLDMTKADPGFELFFEYVKATKQGEVEIMLEPIEVEICEDYVKIKLAEVETINE